MLLMRERQWSKKVQLTARGVAARRSPYVRCPRGSPIEKRALRYAYTRDTNAYSAKSPHFPGQGPARGVWGMAPDWRYKRAADCRVGTGDSLFCGKHCNSFRWLAIYLRREIGRRPRSRYERTKREQRWALRWV